MYPVDVDHPAQPPWMSRQSSTSLTTVHVADALLESKDNGVTLVFMKQNLTDISVEAADELALIGRKSPDDESCVERVALGSNRLTTLPQEFALLSRLRYLNLKHNSFSVFPNVLTVMPSLDTLDISHNKIQRLPSDPGQLVNLRVFCFSRNRISRLPSYMTKFNQLSVLEVDRNPIEWPPKSVVERPSKFTTPEAMKAWIRGIQRWIETDISRSPKSLDEDRNGYNDDLESTLEDSFNSWSHFPHSDDEGVTPHARSFSIDSNFTVSSIAESELETYLPSFGQGDRPPPLHLGILRSYSTDTSPTRSPRNYLPSPADSETFFDTDMKSSPTTSSAQQQHGRNASYASGASRSTITLPGKKSMPDLRTAKLNFTKKAPPDVPDKRPPATNFSRTTAKVNDDYSMPSPQSQRQDSGSSASSNTRTGIRFNIPAAPVTTPPVPPSSSTTITGQQSSPTRAVSSMAFERNSYFRRLSTLPAATISNTLPEPLLHLIEAARSLLFAVCQIYQTLEHYTIHAVDERLSSVLRKVLDPASADMMQLINSLDRFDAMSRKTLPPPPVCRGVVEGCKDAVAAFSKVVSVMALQLKVIVAGDDVRYLRSMLLQLYGASAEISCAWQNLIPHMDALKPMLHHKPFPVPATSAMLTGLGSGLEYPVSAPPGSAPLQWEKPPPLSTLRSNSNGGRTHTARRHAGSFSSKDVEIGKKLPSYDIPSPMVRGVALYTPTLRTPIRHNKATSSSVTIAATPPSPLPTSSSTNPTATDSTITTTHSRSGSQVSLQASSASSASSSPSLPPKTTFLELPPNSKLQVDKEALIAVQKAVDVAPIVWTMMEEVLADILVEKPDFRDSLERARTVTRRLTETIRAVQDGDSNADKRGLSEDAHIFVKTVVQLVNVVKTNAGSQLSALRSNMVKLTNATEEFAILLHVSSFSPIAISTPRPYSPKLSASASQLNLLGPPDENRLVPSLSRSRSAQAATTVKIPSPLLQEGSRSALPTQSFKLPVIRRLRERDFGTDPG